MAPPERCSRPRECTDRRGIFRKVNWGIRLLIVIAAFGTARIAKSALVRTDKERASEPYTPSASAAPYVSFGYREAFADVLFVRLLGYFSDENSSGPAVASLAEAVVALDPKFHRVYELGANAMTIARRDVDQSVYLRAIALLDKGMREFPRDWRLPYFAGQIYTQDLQTTAPEQRREWDERGTLLIESAIRKPGAPPTAANWAAMMRTKLGQHERAVENLKEMILLTNDTKARERMIAELATLEERDSAALAAELETARLKFVKAWRAERRSVPATFYVLFGKRLELGFDLGDLATGGRDLIGTDQSEPLEPIDDQ